MIQFDIARILDLIGKRNLLQQISTYEYVNYVETVTNYIIHNDLKLWVEILPERAERITGILKLLDIHCEVATVSQEFIDYLEKEIEDALIRDTKKKKILI